MANTIHIGSYRHGNYWLEDNHNQFLYKHFAVRCDVQNVYRSQQNRFSLFSMLIKNGSIHVFII